jgi:hypothetical protein
MTDSTISENPNRFPAQATAAEFLNQWEREFDPHKGISTALVMFLAGFREADLVRRPEVLGFLRLAHRYATYTGMISIGDLGELQRELHEQRVARGWPDPQPAANGRHTVEPTVESAIIILLHVGLRSYRPGPAGEAGEEEAAR